MKDIALVLWVCLWPISCSICRYFYFQHEKDKRASGTAILIEIIIWIAVAVKLA